MKYIKLVNSAIAEEVFKQALIELQAASPDDTPITDDHALFIINDALVDFYWDADIDATDSTLSDDVYGKLNDLADELEKSIIEGEISSIAIINKFGDVIVSVNLDSLEIEMLYHSTARLRLVIL